MYGEELDLLILVSLLQLRIFYYSMILPNFSIIDAAMIGLLKNLPKDIYLMINWTVRFFQKGSVLTALG